MRILHENKRERNGRELALGRRGVFPIQYINKMKLENKINK